MCLRRVASYAILIAISACFSTGAQTLKPHNPDPAPDTQSSPQVDVLPLLVLDPKPPGFQPPIILSRPAADFSQCHDKKMNTVVLLQVDAGGSPKNVDLPPTGSKSCSDKAALAAAKLYRFTPAHIDGRPIACNIAVKFETQPQAAGGISAPILIRAAEPEYPPEFLGRRGRAIVRVFMKISLDGTPSQLRVSSQNAVAFERSALNAVHQYRFWPAMQNGQPVAADLFIDVAFQMN
jgi:TonB family protein